MNYIEAANVIKAGLEDLSIDVVDADQEKALEVAVSACERISKYRKKAKRWKRKALEKHPVGHADLQKDIELAPMREKVLSDIRTCKTCKFDPPEDKWPCKDCDMNVYDRWELNDYSGYAKGYSDGKEQTTENYENEKKYLRLFDPKKLRQSQCPLYSVSEDGRGQCKILDESPEDTPLAKEQSCDDDVISREAALTIAGTHTLTVDETVKAIKNLPPVTQKSKMGYWTRELIRNEKGGCIGAKMICSKCGNDNKHDEYMSYCPNCGAKMESEK